MKCRKKKDGRCHQKNDVINECIDKMVKADAIIIGSPVYYADLSVDAKALIDVAGYSFVRPQAILSDENRALLLLPSEEAQFMPSTVLTISF